MNSNPYRPPKPEPLRRIWRQPTPAQTAVAVLVVLLLIRWFYTL